MAIIDRKEGRSVTTCEFVLQHVRILWNGPKSQYLSYKRYDGMQLEAKWRTSMRRRVPLSAATPASLTALQPGADASAMGGVAESVEALSADMM